MLYILENFSVPKSLLEEDNRNLPYASAQNNSTKSSLSFYCVTPYLSRYVFRVEILRSAIYFYNFIIYSIAMSFHLYFAAVFVLGEKRKVRVLSKVSYSTSFFSLSCGYPFPSIQQQRHFLKNRLDRCGTHEK